MKAADIMARDVVTVRPEATVREVAQLLVERGISGVPVVDAEGALVGIVSEGDLVRRAEIGTERRRPRWLSLFVTPDAAAEEFVKAHGSRVADVMSRRPVGVPEDADLGHVATIMERHRIKRVPVVRQGAVVGIVSRADLVRALAELPLARIGEKPVSDRQAEADVLRRIRAQPSGMPWLVRVTVEDGVAVLTGPVSSEAERRALAVAAEESPGVREVQDRLYIERIHTA